MENIQDKIDEYALAKCQEMLRDIYRKKQKRYRELHREEHKQ